MSKYNVFVYNAATYEGVEANSEEEAKRIALEKWLQSIPTVIVIEKKEEEKELIEGAGIADEQI